MNKQTGLVERHHKLLERLDKLTNIGVALSRERNTSHLLEKILLEAKALTCADGGTLYTVTEERQLKFEIVRTDSLGIAMGGSTGQAINFPRIPLYDGEERPNDHTVVAYSVLHDRTINIPDAYEAEGFDFTGTRAFDKRNGYRSKSFLTVPMKNHQEDIIGVLQLLNKVEEESGEVTAFSDEDQHLAESLASQAAVALTTKRLLDDLKNLFEAFIQLIASAIDEKSPYTGAHCRRVPVLTLMLADATVAADRGPFSDFVMTEEERYELEIAAWLHDCGKVVTPVNVVDKATKLEVIHDRIHDIESRYEVLKRDAEIDMLRRRVAALEAGVPHDPAAMEAELQALFEILDEEFDFIRRANIGGEFMSEDDCKRVWQIGQRRWSKNGEEREFLSENEVYNLTIAKGTLTPEEREIINNHVVVTIKMLESLPFPKHLKNVPEYAGGHHERMDGKGYPRGLTRQQMSPQARMMAIADIFEALTASDRPYKSRKTVSESLRIMGFMKKEGHVDPDLFDIFIRERLYEKYAHEFLDPDQIDAVDVTKIPGYEGP